MGVFRIRIFKQGTLIYPGRASPLLRPRDGEQLPQVTQQVVAEPKHEVGSIPAQSLLLHLCTTFFDHEGALMAGSGRRQYFPKDAYSCQLDRRRQAGVRSSK